MSAKKINVSELSETQKLIDLVNRVGLEAAAKQYDTHASTLSRWIRSQGYSLRRTYILTEKVVEVLKS